MSSAQRHAKSLQRLQDGAGYTVASMDNQVARKQCLLPRLRQVTNERERKHALQQLRVQHMLSTEKLQHTASLLQCHVCQYGHLKTKAAALSSEHDHLPSCSKYLGSKLGGVFVNNKKSFLNTG